MNNQNVHGQSLLFSIIHENIHRWNKWKTSHKLLYINGGRSIRLRASFSIHTVAAPIRYYNFSFMLNINDGCLVNVMQWTISLEYFKCVNDRGTPCEGQWRAKKILVLCTKCSPLTVAMRWTTICYHKSTDRLGLFYSMIML